ncbi:uncharacterized protein DS421_11g325230 [Arachis hypogaea]|nr:uncharacterized protein DS421_11g325230 [Arachis hypogaea]
MWFPHTPSWTSFITSLAWSWSRHLSNGCEKPRLYSSPDVLVYKLALRLNC